MRWSEEHVMAWSREREVSAISPDKEDDKGARRDKVTTTIQRLADALELRRDPTTSLPQHHRSLCVYCKLTTRRFRLLLQILITYPPPSTPTTTTNGPIITSPTWKYGPFRPKSRFGIYCPCYTYQDLFTG
jgi:hypothetical protein